MKQQETFYVNPYINMETVTDSIELDSNETIASLEDNEIKATIEVVGDISVTWQPDITKDGKTYYSFREFPQEMKTLIRNNPYWYEDKRIYVNLNNWFELFVEDKTNNVYDSYIVDIEKYNKTQLYELLKESIEDYRKTR